MFDIKYTIKLTISVKSTGEIVNFEQPFTSSLDLPDDMLYDNFHEIRKDYILNFLRDKVSDFLDSKDITEDDIEIETYEIIPNTSNVDIFFVNSEDENQFTLSPTIKVYIHPQIIYIEEPVILGEAISSEAIKWSWNSEIEKDYSHYVVSEKDEIIAQLPIGIDFYIETNLNSNTSYTRKLVKYNTSISKTSTGLTVKTLDIDTVTDIVPYNKYADKFIENQYNNFNLEEDNYEDTRLEAFHSGVGDNKDLFVTKQTELDIYEKFGLDMKLFGTYIDRRSVYEQVAFDYRIRAFGNYIEKENNGNLDMILHAYPIEYITYRIYRYGMREVSARYRVKCQCKYYVYVTVSIGGFGGGSSSEKVLEVRYKNLVSDIYDFTFQGTATFDESDGFAKLDFIPLESGKPISSRSLYEIMNAIASSDSNITESGVPWSLFDYQIEDDYQFDENNYRYSADSARPFSNGINGTLKTSAQINDSGMDSDSLVYAYGFSEACLFEIQQYVTHEINLLEGVKTTLTKSEITTDDLINIADESQTLYYTNSSIHTKVSVFEKERDIVVDTLDKDALQSIISTSHIDPNGQSGQFQSDILKYDFSSDDPYTMAVACYVIKGIDMSKNIDPVTDVELTKWRPREYMFVPEILKTTGNIDLGGKKVGTGLYYNVVAGQFIKYRGKGYYGVTMFANLVDVIKLWEETLPHLDTEPLHGIVNGRFDLNPAFIGKKDLLVTAPEFQIPSFVISDTIRYNVLVSNLNPEKAFVASTFTNRDENNYGTKNADIITFSSDSTFMRDFSVRELIQTISHNGFKLINTYEEELSFIIYKSDEAKQKDYKSYDVEIRSTNNNVFIDSTPIDVQFDEEDKFDIDVFAKYQQNAVAHWSPRIHSGYYYINNEEHFLHSSFESTGNFIPVQIFVDDTVHYTIKCDLKKVGGQQEHYNIARKAEHEFIADKTVFDWDEEKLFPQPIIKAKRYREYNPQTDYVSDAIVFKKPINSCDKITWKFDVPEPAEMSFWIRTFDARLGTDDGIWSEWIEITNGSGADIIPSSAMQFKIIFKPKTTNVYEDYMELIEDEISLLQDMDADLSENILYENDILQCSNPTKDAVFYSIIDDYGSTSTLRMELYHNQKGAEIYVAGSNDKEALKNSPSWVKMTGTTSVGAYRYLRYKIEMPINSEVYLAYKFINAPVTTCYIPKFGELEMNFTHIEPDRFYKFTEDYDAKIPFDTKWHTINENVQNSITYIITEAGFSVDDIENLDIFSNDMTSEMRNTGLLIEARSLEPEYDITYSPYIIFDNNTCELTGLPQQFCPVILQHDVYGSLQYVSFYDDDGNPTLINNESFISKFQKAFFLKFNIIDTSTLIVKINGEIIDNSKYKLTNNMIEFNEMIDRDILIETSYKLRNSFCIVYDIDNDKITIKVNSDTPIEKARIMFDSNKYDNRYVATHLSFNPIHNISDKGFVYITYDIFPVYDFEIRCNNRVIKADGKDRTQIYIIVKDSYGNPVPGEILEINNDSDAKMIINDLMTDINGVVTVQYISATNPCKDKINVKSTSLDETKEITITNK